MIQKRLEQYKYFPAIAWTLCILMTLFVGYLALELKTTAENLKQTSLNLDQRIQSVEESDTHAREADD